MQVNRLCPIPHSQRSVCAEWGQDLGCKCVVLLVGYLSILLPFRIKSLYGQNLFNNIYIYIYISFYLIWMKKLLWPWIHIFILYVKFEVECSVGFFLVFHNIFNNLFSLTLNNYKIHKYPFYFNALIYRPLYYLIIYYIFRFFMLLSFYFVKFILKLYH